MSSSLCGVPAGLALAEALGLLVVVVVVAGDIAAVEGVIPGAGERPGTVADAPGAVVVVVVVAGEVIGAVAGLTGAVAGLMAGLRAVVGGAPGGLLAGDVAGGGWPNDVSARVRVQRLAISSVFIGLSLDLSRPRIPVSWVSS